MTMLRGQVALKVIQEVRVSRRSEEVRPPFLATT